MKKINSLTVVSCLLTLAIVGALLYAFYPVLQKKLQPKAETVEDSIIVPDLIGMQEMDAEKTVEMLGVKKVRAVTSPEKPGTILAQEPKSGTRVDPYTTIFVDVSAGADTVHVPEVVGMDASEALTALRDLNMSNIKTEKKYEGTFASVVSIDPEPGTEMTADELVTLGIQVGEEKAATPGSYIGLSFNDAVKKAKEDLLIPVPDYAYTDLYEKGVVFMQSVEKNAPVMAGSNVTLTVSLGAVERDVKEIRKVKLGMPETATGTAYRIYAREKTPYDTSDLLIESGESTQFPLSLEVPILRGVTDCVLYYEELSGESYVPRAKWEI